MEGIRSKDRVDKFGEVFTPEKTVKDMLNLLPCDFDLFKETCFEPSCGDGNFLVEILSRKLSLMPEISDVNILSCIATIYGVDIQADNVMDSRKRMLGIVQDFCIKENYTISPELQKNIELILQWNICLGDFLEDKYIKMNNEGYILLYESEQLTDLRLINDDGSRIDISFLFTAKSSDKFGKLVMRTWNVQDMLFTVEDVIEKKEYKNESKQDMFSNFQSLLGGFK